MFANGNFNLKWRLLFVIFISAFASQVYSAPAQLTLENELLLELRLDGGQLGLDILGYQRGEDFLLSLDEFTNGLGFPIAVDGAQGTADGWFISNHRGFSLDMERATVISDGKLWPLAVGDVVLFEGGLYVETKALQKWFPLRLSAVLRELYLDVEPLEPLPIQQRFSRRGRVFANTIDDMEPKYPLQETPFQGVGPHTTKLRLGYSSLRQNTESDTEIATSYATLSRGDLGWMTSTLAFAGRSGDSFTGARLKLERTAFDGPLGLNHIEVGDVDAGGYRGFLLRGSGGRNDKDSRFDAESVNLEGSQLPDWDVELYQNGQLVMVQTTGQEGRYLFEDVPLLFGNNRFELKFFGPYGEIETREEFHYLGVGMLEPGRLSYEMAAVQSGRTVFGVNDADGEGDQDSGIYSSNVNFGLSRNLTMGAGIRSLEQNGERVASSNINIGLSTSRFYGSLRYLDVPNAQNSLSTSLRTQIGDTSVNLGFTRFFEESELVSSAQQWRSSVDVTSSTFRIPLKVKINTQERDDSTQFDAVLGTTTFLPGVGRLSTSLWYGSVEERLNGSILSDSQTGGQTSFFTSIRPWTLRLSAGYSFAPEAELLELSAVSALRIDRDLTLDLSLRQNSTTDTTYYGGGINWQLDQVAVNASVNYDSDERWVGLITLSTGLVHQPGTLRPRLDSLASVDAGSVEVRVFEDTDVTDGESHAGVVINGVQAWRRATTDENGIAYLSRMPSHRRVDIELDDSTLADNELRSKKPGVSIIPRPGSYALIDFPIVRTAELEGHVVVTDGDVRKPVSRALVFLKTPDGEVVAQRRTAFDGFYLFDGIQPGIYQVSLDEPLGGRLLNGPGSVTVLSSNGVISGLDFALRADETRSLALDRLVLDEVLQKQSGSPVPGSPILGIRTNSAPGD